MKYIIPLIVLISTLACSLTAAPPSSPTQARAAIKPAQLTQAQISTCTVTAVQSLNLREGPGTDSAVIAVLAHGDLVTIRPEPAQGIWIPIQARDLIGWINSTYCKKEK